MLRKCRVWGDLSLGPYVSFALTGLCSTEVDPTLPPLLSANCPQSCLMSFFHPCGEDADSRGAGPVAELVCSYLSLS